MMVAGGVDEDKAGEAAGELIWVGGGGLDLVNRCCRASHSPDDILEQVP